MFRTAGIGSRSRRDRCAGRRRARTDCRVARVRRRPRVDKFSKLTDIDRSNVARLTKAWEWATGETPKSELRTRPGNFQATPLMLGDTLFLSTSYNRVVALDASSGKEFWEYDPKPYAAGQPSNGTGFVHRGVATWTDGKQRRIFINSRWNLVAIDAATGQPIRSFGDTGVVDLTARLERNGKKVNKLHYTETSPPVVWRDLVIVGNGVADRLIYPNDPPGDVQAFDVRSGKRAWNWSPVPRDDRDTASRTWDKESWKITGHANVWAPFTVDDARGLVYLPVSTPSNDWYGGARLGNNLYAESVVCLEAKSGKLKWAFQTVHHGLWDYDLPAAPVLASVTVNGKSRDIVAVPAKTGFLFVFDRVSGEPIWPIEERSVPASDVPGREGGAVATVSHEAEGVCQAGIRLRRPDRLHAGDQGARARGDERAFASARSSRRPRSRERS